MNDASLVIIAIVLALGLVGVLTVGVLMMPQQAEARGCENGQSVSLAVNSSQGRCFGH